MIHTPIDGAAGQTADTETLGERLARLRQMQGWTKTAIAERLGLSVAAICHWEQDRSRPKSARLQELAQLFDISTTDLLRLNAAPGNQKLADLVERTRVEIARAAGTNPSKIRIVIEM